MATAATLMFLGFCYLLERLGIVCDQSESENKSKMAAHKLQLQVSPQPEKTSTKFKRLHPCFRLKIPFEIALTLRDQTGSAKIQYADRCPTTESNFLLNEPLRLSFFDPTLPNARVTGHRAPSVLEFNVPYPWMVHPVPTPFTTYKYILTGSVSATYLSDDPTGTCTFIVHYPVRSR